MSGATETRPRVSHKFSQNMLFSQGVYSYLENPEINKVIESSLCTIGQRTKTEGRILLKSERKQGSLLPLH